MSLTVQEKLTDGVLGSKPLPMNACRFCHSALDRVFIDLGMSPLCESYRSVEQMNDMEPFYPLRVYICSRCFLVQLPEHATPDSIFSEYAYFSSYSDSWLAHVESYAKAITERLELGSRSLVVEIASNDGYLLQYFVRGGIPVLGIEPAGNVAEAAKKKGIPTEVKFFGVSAAKEMCERGRQPDLLIGNNVLAHVPDINDFVAGLKLLLGPNGVLTMEFPHLLRLMENNQFDTIYHEHFSYLSFRAVDRIFSAHGLELFDVEEISTHGGSLRVYAKHEGSRKYPVESKVLDLKRRELEAGFESMEFYKSFSQNVMAVKRELLSFLIDAKNKNRHIAGYGAPGKGNTLLNYCGIRTDLLEYTVDRNPYKQGKFLPGTGIPIYPVDRIAETKPDYVLILPWNLKAEIMEQLKSISEWGGRFIIPIPKVEVI
jgi:SAM-dependent methyltransferase